MRKALSLGVVVLFLMAGLSFGWQNQPAQSQNQNQSQPLIIQLFGVYWVGLITQRIGSFDSLDADVVALWARDQIGRAGIIEIVAIVSRDKKKAKILYGWVQPYSLDEQGFFLGKDGNLVLLDRKKDINAWLEVKGDYDQEGNPRLTFYIKGKDGSEKIVRIINIKEFVEKEFKNGDGFKK